MGLIGVGKYIGEDDVINDRPYKCTCKCIKDADVFCMKSEEFVRRLKPNRESWRIITEGANVKE